MTKTLQNRIADDATRVFSYRNSSEVFELIVAFENCTLPPEKWTRAAFLTVIFWYVYMNPLPEARRLIRDGLRRYIFEHCGTATGGSEYRVSTLFTVRKASDYLNPNKGKDFFVELVNRFLLGLSDEEAAPKPRKKRFTPPVRNEREAKIRAY